MAYDGELRFNTGIDTSGFTAGLGKIGGIASAGFSVVAKSVGVAATAISAFGAYSAGVGSSFEDSMSQVCATMGITKDTVVDGVKPFDILKQAANDAGATTKYSASEAADALNFLASAGYSAQQASDALPAVLNLASAGSLDLADASTLAADSMAALGIEATNENLTDFGDKIAKTAAAANTDVSQLGEAILTVGGTAKSLSGGVTELNASLGVLSNRGIKGAEGGTQLRNIIVSLAAPTDKAAGALDALGISVYDAEGNMRPLNDVFKDLDASMANMSDGEKTQVLSKIFNKEDLKSVNALLSGCGDEFDNLTDALNNSGGAMQQMADTMNDNLSGDVKEMQSGAEALGIAVYDKMQEPLRELADKGTGYLSQLTSAFSGGGFQGLASEIGTVLSSAITYITDSLPGIVALGVSTIQSFVSGIIGNLGTITESALQIGIMLINALISIFPSLIAAGIGVIANLLSGISSALPQLAPAAQAGITTIVQAIGANLPMILNAGMTILGQLLNGILSQIPKLTSTAVNLVSQLIATLTEHLPEILTAGIQILVSIVEGIARALPDLIPQAVACIITICDTLLDNLPDIIRAAIEILIALIQGLANALPQLVSYVPQIIISIIQALLDNIEQIITCGIQVTLAIIKGLAQALPELVAYTPTIIKALIDAFTSVDWIGIGGNIISGIADGVMDAASTLIDSVVEAAKTALDAVKSFLGIHSPSRKMRDEVGKFMMPGVAEGVEDTIPDTENQINSDMDKLVKNIDVDGIYAQFDNVSRSQATVPSYSQTFKDVQKGSSANSTSSSSGETSNKKVELVFNIDGKSFARATASEMDIVNGSRINLVSRGVAIS